MGAVVKLQQAMRFRGLGENTQLGCTNAQWKNLQRTWAQAKGNSYFLLWASVYSIADSESDTCAQHTCAEYQSDTKPNTKTDPEPDPEPISSSMQDEPVDCVELEWEAL